MSSQFGPVYLPITADRIRHAAVAISATGHVQNHASILFRDTGGNLKVLDLQIDSAWRGTIVTEEYDPSRHAVAWAQPALKDRVLRNIARSCQSFSAKPLRVRYAFQFYKITKLEVAGQSWSLAGALGLTCATFVLAVFQSRGFPLVDVDDWPENDPDDERWQKRNENAMYVAVMTQNPRQEDLDFLEEHAKHLPCARFRPDDVIGACRSGIHPAKHFKSRAAGTEVASWIRVSP
jgi:hypothetical protein